MKPNRLLILFLPLFFGSSPAFCAKLDISADTDVKAVSYSNINFTQSKNFFYIQNASLAVKIKSLKPSIPSKSDSSIDIGIVLRSVGISGSTVSASYPPFERAAARYPSSNMMPFVEQAYIKANRLFDRNVSLWAGKQAFTLGSGLALSDDGLGLTGIRLAINQIWKDINWQMFTYQPKSAMPGQGGIDLLGTYLEIPLEGIWSLYTLWEIDKRGDVVASQPVNGASRQFSGISYGLTYGSFIFDGEAAIEKGRAKAVGKNINFNGSAFLISGRWTHDTAKFGQIAGRVAFGRASGDKESTKGADEAFFPSFGHRYSGLERSGFGEIFGASLYDAQGGNPLSKNGLPTGVSGVQVYKMGATLSVFKTFPLYFSADFYSFESSVSPSGKKLGNEWDFGLSYPASEQFNISLIYAAFTPGNGYSSDAKSPKKISFQASAKF